MAGEDAVGHIDKYAKTDYLYYNDHFSSEFVALVNKYCPGYDEIQKRGKDYEIMLRADGWLKMKL